MEEEHNEQDTSRDMQDSYSCCRQVEEGKDMEVLMHSGSENCYGYSNCGTGVDMDAHSYHHKAKIHKVK